MSDDFDAGKFTWVGVDMAEPDDWQPAIIADSKHCLRFHRIDPGQTTCHAGKKIRVRPCQEAHHFLKALSFLHLGCLGQHLEVHPEDAERLWPEITARGEIASVCDCQLLLD
jgi:hypothetical protein